MMWAIFSSLAFCTFPIISADLIEGDMFASQFALIQQLNQVQYKAYLDVGAAAKAIKIKEMRWEEIEERCIYTDYNQRFEKNYETKSAKCDQCYHKAKNAKDVQVADNCCKKVIAEFKKDTEEYIAQAKPCIAKCAQDGRKCREELMNISKRDKKGGLEYFEDNTKNV